MEVLKRNDEFYREHYHEDPPAFHQAHHRYLEWYTNYLHFMKHQDLLASADREKEIFKYDLTVMEALEYCLKGYKELGCDFSIENAMEIVDTVKSRLAKDLEGYEEIIPELERNVEDNEYFREHDYFEDVDPIGYKNLSWEEYLEKRCKIGTNNSPEITKEKKD